MAASSLFIGVVSHVGSRFAVSQGPGGLAAVLAERLRSLGQSVLVEVSTVDAHNPEQMPITPAMVGACLTAQVHLDRRWARYLGRARGPRWWATHGLRWARRAEQLVRQPGSKMVERLLNIELAHFALLRSGLATGAEWVLILEDDASSIDVVDCAAGLAWLMSSRTDEKQPAYVNISQSFALDELGLAQLLTVAPDASWAGETSRRILTSARPATNTVCAILYRGSFVRELLAVTDSLPMEPVVPIDWKLNLSLMQMFETGGSVLVIAGSSTRRPLTNSRCAARDNAVVKGYEQAINSVAGLVGLQVSRTNSAAVRLPVEATAADAALIASLRPYTMTSAERLWSLLNAVRYVIDEGLPGDFAECGVWRGGSVMAMAKQLLAQDVNDRRIWLYDTFAGMTAPTAADVEAGTGVTAETMLAGTEVGDGNNVWCVAGLSDVQTNVRSTGYPFDQFTFVEGDVAITLKQSVPESISLLRIDTDWYESTKLGLEILYPRLVVGGVCILDDYGHWQGARTAVDEYFAATGHRPFMHPIDYSGRVFIKTR